MMYLYPLSNVPLIQKIECRQCFFTYKFVSVILKIRLSPKCNNSFQLSQISICVQVWPKSIQRFSSSSADKKLSRRDPHLTKKNRPTHPSVVAHMIGRFIYLFFMHCSNMVFIYLIKILKLLLLDGIFCSCDLYHLSSLQFFA